MSNENVKKVFGIISKVFSWIIIAVTVFMMIFTIISSTTLDKNDRSIFGLKFYIVLSDSMSPSENNKDDKVHFSAGDMVIIKSVKNNFALQPGDIIAFINQNENMDGVKVGDTITHRIREVVRDDEGRVEGYVTYGTNTGVNDEKVVTPSFVIGKYAGKLPSVGYFFQFLRTTPGYIVCILVPFLLLIIWQGANTIKLFRQYKREQMADIEAERAEIAKEREQSLQMMRELQALKEQLAMQAAQTETVTPMEQSDAVPKTAAEQSADTDVTEETAGTDTVDDSQV